MKKVKRKRIIQECDEWKQSSKYWLNRCFNAEQILINHQSYWDTVEMDHKICSNAVDTHLGELVTLLYQEESTDSAEGE